LDDQEDCPLVSVVISNYKGTSDLKVCLEAIARSDYLNFGITVVDVCTPGIADWISQSYPSVKLIAIVEDKGPGAARNAGMLGSLDSDYVLLIDDDVVVQRDTLSRLVSALAGAPEVGAAQPVLFRLARPAVLDSLGGSIDCLCFACRPTSRNVLVEYADIFYAEGAVVLRTSVVRELLELGLLFDESYFIYWEDVDFCWTILQLGYRIILVQEAVALHRRGVSGRLGGVEPFLVFLNARNRVFTMFKHLGVRRLVFAVLPMLFFQLCQALALLASRPRHSAALLMGTIDGLFDIRLRRRSRRAIQHARRRDDDWVQERMCPFNPTRLIRDFVRHYGVEPKSGGVFGMNIDLDSAWMKG